MLVFYDVLSIKLRAASPGSLARPHLSVSRSSAITTSFVLFATTLPSAISRFATSGFETSVISVENLFYLPSVSGFDANAGYSAFVISNLWVELSVVFFRASKTAYQSSVSMGFPASWTATIDIFRSSLADP